MSKMPRIQAVVLPLLRAENLTVVTDVSTSAVTINSWVPDVDYRQFPLIQIRRLGGFRHPTHPTKLSLPVIEMTAYTDTTNGGDLIVTEQLYEDALEALYAAVKNQTQTSAGYLHSIKETLGSTQFSSLFQNSWRTQGLIQFGLRPPRT